jgi:cell division protein FtsL
MDTNMRTEVPALTMILLQALALPARALMQHQHWARQVLQLRWALALPVAAP